MVHIGGGFDRRGYLVYPQLLTGRYKDMKVYIFKLPRFLSRLLKKLGVR